MAAAKIGIPDRRRRPRFPHFAPDFVVELRSPDDRLSRLRPKMHEWIDNGTALAWLVDPERRAVEIYRPGLEPETLLDPQSVSGEGPVEGFVLDLGPVLGPYGSLIPGFAKSASRIALSMEPKSRGSCLFPVSFGTLVVT